MLETKTELNIKIGKVLEEIIIRKMNWKKINTAKIGRKIGISTANVHNHLRGKKVYYDI